ncbi:MAG: DUF1152 domain-containing protein [Fervidicoccaceae archaeon]
MREALKWCERALFVGIGGGGDAVSAALLALAARREGLSRAFFGSVVWERLPRDPLPGPIPLSQLRGATTLSRGLAICEGGCSAERDGTRVEPQASLVAGALREGAYLFDLSLGVDGMVSGLREASRLLELECVVGVDVGGDVLAESGEENAWSPLADSIGLAALARLERERGPRAIIAVHSPGADGELGPARVLERVSLVAERGGYLGARGLTARDAEVLEKLLSVASTEASAMQLRAFRGERGIAKLRGNRFVELSILQTLTFFLEARAVYELSDLAKSLIETTTIEEARRRLNSLGVYTELDLEEDARSFREERGRWPTGEEIAELRRIGRNRIRRQKQMRREQKIGA